MIAEFNARRSEEAFAALVRQHVNLVFATALRQVGDAGAAEEITQNVFVALAQAAGKLGSHPTIAGWLHQTALNKSREWLRSELRRRKREQVAVNLDLARAEGDSVWSPLVPLLDEALLELREPDRLAVILHYMEGRTFHEVGSALGIGEDTARKRVNRCLDQLTHFFRRRGFAAPALAAGAPLFALSSHAAPAGLAASATTAGVAAAHSAASTSTLTLIKGALKIMAWTKMRTAIVAGVVALLLAAGTTTITVKEIAAHRDEIWQKRWDVSMVDKMPPQVKILPALRSRSAKTEIAVVAHGGKLIGLGNDFQDLLIMAYHFTKSQMIFLTAVPEGRYDFISNLPKGQDEALQREIQRKFGVIVRREMIETNVLNLTVRSSHADGLRRSNARSRTAFSAGPGSLVCHGQMIYTFVDYLTRSLGTPVIDQTGLHENLDIDLNWDSTTEGLKQATLDQLGLELVPSREPVEMLVVERVKN